MFFTIPRSCIRGSTIRVCFVRLLCFMSFVYRVHLCTGVRMCGLHVCLLVCLLCECVKCVLCASVMSIVCVVC